MKLLTRWKFLVSSKYFWVRYVSASCVGECLFSAISFPMWIWSDAAANLTEAFNLFIHACTFRTIFTAILAVPGIYLVSFLKIIEKTEFNEQNNNPFIKLKCKVPHEYHSKT